MIYPVTWDDVATGAVADTYKTVASIIVPDTAGVRARIRSIRIASSDDTPTDKPVRVRIIRIADVSNGTAGTAATSISAANIPKLDPAGPVATFSAKLDYSVEPTTFETDALWQDAFNDRGGIDKTFCEEDARPSGIADQLLAVQVAPSTAAAIKTSGGINVEVY